MTIDLARHFGPGGTFERSLEGWRVRPQQLEFAQAVLGAIESAGILIGQGRLEFYFRHGFSLSSLSGLFGLSGRFLFFPLFCSSSLPLFRPYRMVSLCRIAWHWTFTATGRLAMWQGSTSKKTSREVVFPP